MAVTYLRLFCPTTQFQLKNGAINVAGLLKVKLEGTDDYAPVFDEDGTQLAQPVILDNNGRSKGLFVDASKVYWLEVDDRDGYELFTIRKMTPCGGGGGSSLGGNFEVVSSDGTVSVERYDDGGITYFDLSTSVTNQAATWGATFATANSVTGDDNWEMLPVVTSAGTSPWNNGWKASKDCVADIAASLEMDGDSSAISTVDVMCVFSVDGVGVSTEYSQLDPSDSRGKVSFEYKGALQEGQVVDCRIFVKSVEAMAPALVAKAYFNEECDGIIGGGSEGGDYHAGDYVEITDERVINVTGLQPQSAMSSYVQQSSFSSISSVVSSIQNDTGYISSVVSGITGGFTGYVPYSALSGDGSKITGIDGSAIGGTDYSAGEYIDISGNTISVTGLQPVSGMSSYVEKSAFDDCCSAMSGYVSSLSSRVSSLESSVSSISSTVSGLTGTYVEISSISGYSSIWNSASGMSGKLDESAFTAYTSTAQGFTGVTTDSSLTGNGTPGSALGVNRMELVFDSSMSTSISGDSAIVGVNSAIMSGKLDNSASSTWYPYTGNPSGFLTEHQDLSGYVEKSSISAESSQWNDVSSKIPWSALSGDGVKITGISGSAVGGTDYSAGEYVSIAGDTISVTGLQPVSAMSSYVEKSAISAQSSQWNEASGMSGKLDNSASSTWYPMTGNPSGFLTGHQDLSGYVPVSAISAESSTWNSASAISAVIPWSALEGTGSTITAISGSAIGGSTSTGGKTYSGIDPVVVDNTADTISVKHSGLTADDTMTAYTSGTDIVIGVNTGTLASSMIPWDALSGDGTSITGISGSAIGGGGDFVEKSSISAESSTWNSASAISAVIPWSALSGDGTSITGISGSAIGGATGDYVEKSATEVSIGYANSAITDSLAQGSNNTASSRSFAQGSGNIASSYSLAQGASNTATSRSFAQGSVNSAAYYSLAQGYLNSAASYSLAQGSTNRADSYAFAQGRGNSSYNCSFAQGSGNSARNQSFAQGLGISAKNTAAAFGQHNLRGDGEKSTGDSAAFVIGDGTASSKRHDLMVVTKDGEITMFSSTADTTGTGIMSSIRAISAAATGGVDSATVSAIASSYAESAASGKQDSSAMTAYQLSGDYAYNSSLSGYIPTSESSNYQQVSAMTAYQPSGDYAYNSALTAYQPSGDYAYNSALTAYQPSGDYIYASALGTGVI